MSTKSVVFNPIFPVWITLAIAGLLSAYFIFKEIQRARSFVILRVAMQILIGFSLLGFVLHPSYKGDAKSESILLLTKGFNQRKADSLVEKYSVTAIQTSDAPPY